jgi:hypothetical protein
MDIKNSRSHGFISIVTKKTFQVNLKTLPRPIKSDIIFNQVKCKTWAEGRPPFSMKVWTRLAKGVQDWQQFSSLVVRHRE